MKISPNSYKPRSRRKPFWDYFTEHDGTVPMTNMRFATEAQQPPAYAHVMYILPFPARRENAGAEREQEILRLTLFIKELDKAHKKHSVLKWGFETYLGCMGRITPSTAGYEDGIRWRYIAKGETNALTAAFATLDEMLDHIKVLHGE